MQKDTGRNAFNMRKDVKEILAAIKNLDDAPIPTENRMIWDAVTGELIGGNDEPEV